MPTSNGDNISAIRSALGVDESINGRTKVSAIIVIAQLNVKPTPK